MLHLNGIHLKNSICFADAYFEIKPGVSAIYGLNHTNARHGSNPNGAGKSAFFGQFKEILFEEPIVGIKQDAVKDGTRVIDMRIGNKDVKVTRTNNKLDVEARRNGKVYRSKGKTPAKQWLQSNLPLTEEDFDTYVYLDSRVHHPLVMGSSTARRNFFNSFFGLDKLDLEKKLFVAEYAKLKQSKITYADTLVDYKALKARIQEIEISTKQEAYKELKTRLASLQEKNQKLNAVTQLLTFETQMAAYISQLRKICHEPKITEGWFQEIYKTAKWNLKHNQEGLNDAMAWERYQADNQAYIEAYNGLSKNTKAMLRKMSVAEALSRCKTKVKALREAQDALEADQNTVKRLKTQLVKPEKPEGKLPTESEGDLRTALKVAKHKLEHAVKFNKGVCDSCGQSVKVVSPEKLKQSIKSLEAKIDLIAEIENYQSELEAYTENKAAYTKAKANLVYNEERVANLNPYEDVYNELRGLPAKPAVFEGKKYEVAVKRRMVDEDKERLTLLNMLEPSLGLIIELDNLSPKAREVAKKAGDLQGRINELQEQASKLHGEIVAYKVLEEQYEALRTKLRKLKAELVNEEPLRLLIEAYSDKAMKKMAIQAISDKLMAVVNKYSKVVFPEDYTFEFNWDTSQLAFLVHRRHGKKVKTSDVRRLSGAESKLFTLVLVLALMTFVPARKRCNVLILDEPTANMGKETIQAFQEIIPVINKIIPSIIIITPKSDEVYPNAEAYTVVKTKGVAKICKGYPSEQR